MSPDRRKHRGAHPEDGKLFNETQLTNLRQGVADLSWLLSRGYAAKGSLKLVGDRYLLAERQRLAISRAACSDESLARRSATEVAAGDLSNNDLMVDGFNLIVTMEAALSGALLIQARDGCIRDLSSVHGSYRAVDETLPAIEFIGEELIELRTRTVTWLLDRPVSNSGRLAETTRQISYRQAWNWKVEVVFNPDAALIDSNQIVVSSDSHVLDHVARWFNLNRYLIEKMVAELWLIDLSC